MKMEQCSRFSWRKGDPMDIFIYIFIFRIKCRQCSRFSLRRRDISIYIYIFRMKMEQCSRFSWRKGDSMDIFIYIFIFRIKCRQCSRFSLRRREELTCLQSLSTPTWLLHHMLGMQAQALRYQIDRQIDRQVIIAFIKIRF